VKITVASHYFHEEKQIVKNGEIDILQDKLLNSIRIIKTIISECKFGDTHRSAHLDGFFSFIYLKLLVNNAI